MSIKVPISALSLEQLILIRKFLVITPKQQFIPGQKWFDEEPIVESIHCWIEDGNFCYLPYSFAIKILGCNPNLFKPFFATGFNFRGSLITDDYKDQVADCVEALQYIDETNCVRLELHTGRGKTVQAAYLLAQRPGITLVIVPLVGLLDQWKKTFDDLTDATSWIIDTPIITSPHIIICTPGKIDKINEKYPGFLEYVENLVLDEVHMLCTPKRFSAILSVQPKRIIACTATYERRDDLHNIITAIVGPEKIKKVIKKPFVVYKYLSGISVELEQNVRGQTDWTKYVAALVNNDQRNIQILRLVKENYQNHKILILTWREAHVTQLCDWIREMGISCDYMTGTKKKYQDSNVLVGTDKKLGTGFDEAAACLSYNGVRIDLLLLTLSTKNDKLLEQMVGRGMRSDYPLIIHFVDDMAISKRHWTVANKWYSNPERECTVNNFESTFLKEKKAQAKLNKNPNISSPPTHSITSSREEGREEREREEGGEGREGGEGGEEDIRSNKTQASVQLNSINRIKNLKIKPSATFSTFGKFGHSRAPLIASQAIASPLPSPSIAPPMSSPSIAPPMSSPSIFSRPSNMTTVGGPPIGEKTLMTLSSRAPPISSLPVLKTTSSQAPPPSTIYSAGLVQTPYSIQYTNATCVREVYNPVINKTVMIDDDQEESSNPNEVASVRRRQLASLAKLRKN